MRMIDKDALLKHEVEADRMGAMLVVGKGYILSAPEVDAVPVVRGEWRFRSNGHNITRSGDYEEWHECSVCKLSADYPSSYCPNCGCDMRGERDGEK